MLSQNAACWQAECCQLKMILDVSDASYALPAIFLPFLSRVQGGAFSEVSLHLKARCSRGPTEQTRFDGQGQGASPQNTINFS